MSEHITYINETLNKELEEFEGLLKKEVFEQIGIYFEKSKQEFLKKIEENITQNIQPLSQHIENVKTQTEALQQEKEILYKGLQNYKESLIQKEGAVTESIDDFKNKVVAIDKDFKTLQNEIQQSLEQVKQENIKQLQEKSQEFINSSEQKLNQLVEHLQQGLDLLKEDLNQKRFSEFQAKLKEFQDKLNANLTEIIQVSSKSLQQEVQHFKENLDKEYLQKIREIITNTEKSYTKLSSGIENISQKISDQDGQLSKQIEQYINNMNGIADEFRSALHSEVLGKFEPDALVENMKQNMKNSLTLLAKFNKKLQEHFNYYEQKIQTASDTLLDDIIKFSIENFLHEALQPIQKTLETTVNTLKKQDNSELLVEKIKDLEKTYINALKKQDNSELLVEKIKDLEKTYKNKFLQNYIITALFVIALAIFVFFLPYFKETSSISFDTTGLENKLDTLLSSTKPESTPLMLCDDAISSEEYQIREANLIEKMKVSTIVSEKQKVNLTKISEKSNLSEAEQDYKQEIIFEYIVITPLCANSHCAEETKVNLIFEDIKHNADKIALQLSDNKKNIAFEYLKTKLANIDEKKDKDFIKGINKGYLLCQNK